MKKLNIIFVFQIIIFSSLLAQTANVTVNIYPTNSGVVTGAGVYPVGSLVQLEAISNTRYSFLNWSSGGMYLSNDTNYSFIVLSDTTIDANFELQKFNIETVSVPILGGTTTGDGIYSFGDNVTVEAIPSVGYKFADWTVDNIFVSADSSYTFSAESNKKIVANFELKSFEIETVSNPVIGGSTLGNGNYYYGDNATIEAIPSTGYNFVNWEDEEVLVSIDSVYSFTVVKDQYLTANFEFKTYSINGFIEPEQGGSIEGDSIYTHGDNATMTAYPSEGYNFVNWTENGEVVSSDSVYSFIVIENRNLTANFDLKSYSVQTSENPIGSGLTFGDSTYSHGSLVSLTAIAKEGYSFINWTENDVEVSSDSNFTFIINRNRNLIANFSINSYLINTVSNPLQGGITNGGGLFEFGDTVKLTAIPADGYNLIGWFESDTLISSDSVFTFNCTSSQTFTARFSLNQYSVITSISDSSGGTTLGAGNYAHGALVTLQANSNAGWKFDYWTENNNILAIDSNYSFVIFSDKNITANFSKKIYSVELNSNPDNSGLLVGSGQYEYDSLISVSAIPNTGWNFISWEENGNIISTDSTINIKVLGNKKLTASFGRKTYEIATKGFPIEAGTTFGDSIYTHGEEATITAKADSLNGWDFVNWTKNGEIISNDISYTFLADGPGEYIANFALRVYSIQLNSEPNSAGSVEGSGNYKHGDSVTVKANPAAGMLFANWMEGTNNVSSEQIYKFKIEKNRNLTANFANQLYTVISLPEPNEAGVISGSGSFYYGQEATLKPISNTGWKFVNWTENGNEISKDSLLTITVQNNLNIKANFKLINYSIICSVNPSNAGFTSGCGFSYYNQNMMLNATPYEGWEFVGWTENDEVVSNSQSYEFTVNGNRNLVANFDLISDIESIEDQQNIPDDFYLSNAYPNPFNPSTKINFGLPEESSVNILVTNVNGEIVKTILSNAKLSAGNYSSNFKAENLSSGVYFYIITAQSQISKNNFKKVGKLVLLK